ncbi:MAG TPA: DUF3293 domain-containing protein, partial [Gemmatimonadaceae bacterium]|nr:DUF3293 domain-containing protein [Gemmatimonadaceae bacterium]
RLVDEKWAPYPCTVLEFLVPRAPRIDLRKPVGRAERAVLEELGLARPFTIFTAENPWGENAEDAPTDRAEEAAERRNAERRERLEAELRDADVRFLRCDGVAPDGDYREHAVAALLPKDEAIAKAKQYRQLAIFWFDGARFWLASALAAKPDEPLPA